LPGTQIQAAAHTRREKGGGAKTLRTSYEGRRTATSDISGRGCGKARTRVTTMVASAKLAKKHAYRTEDISAGHSTRGYLRPGREQTQRQRGARHRRSGHRHIGTSRSHRHCEQLALTTSASGAEGTSMAHITATLAAHALKTRTRWRNDHCGATGRRATAFKTLPIPHGGHICCSWKACVAASVHRFVVQRRAAASLDRQV